MGTDAAAQAARSAQWSPEQRELQALFVVVVKAKGAALASAKKAYAAAEAAYLDAKVIRLANEKLKGAPKNEPTTGPSG